MKKLNGILRTITNWEAWPFELLYAPLSLCWLWYTVKSGNAWFFTASNPKLTFGGMEGEPKKEMYDLLPDHLYPPTFTVLPQEELDLVEEKLVRFGISYPFIVKPEVGGQGILLRKIDDAVALHHYHSMMPWEYIVQSLVKYPMEVSVFYIRHPQSEKGRVTGFLHKIPLQVTGDGQQTLAELILVHPKGAKRTEELYNKHKENWNRVLAPGETYMLSYAANHNRGAKFVDLKNEINEELVAVFDKISLGINDFFYGRYDIMCSSVADLKKGINFTILEYNGCGAEPNHFYDTGYTLRGAYREILKHWKALYQICKFNRQQGVPRWSLGEGSRFLKSTRQHIREMKKVDAAMG